MDSTNLANEMGTAIDMHANNVFNGMIPMNVSEINWHSTCQFEFSI